MWTGLCRATSKAALGRADEWEDGCWPAVTPPPLSLLRDKAVFSQG